MYFGGLPPQYERDLHQLALPSVLFRTRFRGEIRNVLYGNCSCQTVRAQYLDGHDVTLYPREQCDMRNPCREGCICVSTDTEPACDCSELECISGKIFQTIAEERKLLLIWSYHFLWIQVVLKPDGASRLCIHLVFLNPRTSGSEQGQSSVFCLGEGSCFCSFSVWWLSYDTHVSGFFSGKRVMSRKKGSTSVLHEAPVWTCTNHVQSATTLRGAARRQRERFQAK